MIRKIHVYQVAKEIVVELNRDLYPIDKVALKVALKVAKDLLDTDKVLQVHGGKHDGLKIAPSAARRVDPDGVFEWEAVLSKTPSCEHVAVIPEDLS
jgi:hypothetical protein